MYTIFSPRKVLFLLMMTIMSFGAWSQCTNTTQYPSTTTAISTIGILATITTCSYAGEYSVISGAASGQTLQFATGIVGDIITVRSGSSSGPVLAFGATPLSFANTYVGTIYAHWNTAGCGSQSVCRTTTVQCTSCTAPPAPCTNATPYGTATIDLLGAVITISTCSYAGEYSTISGAVAGQSLKFATSAGDNITVHSGTPSGPVLAFGTSPLTFANTFTGVIYAHWNTAACTSQATCRTTTVQCLSCLGCINLTQFPSGLVSLTPTNTNGAVQNISTCNFAGDFNALTSVLNAKTYRLTSSIATDYATVRIGSANGTILVQGTQPLLVTTTSTSDLYIHWNTNSSCGTQATCRVIAVQCTNCAPPTLLLTCPGPTTVTCASAVPSPNIALVTGSTNCANQTITVSFANDVISSLTCANKYTVKRTYIATDLCGNVGSCTQIITVNDNVAPTIISCPAALSVSCVSNVPVAVPSQVSASDNCSGTLTYSFVNDVISNQTCTNRYSIIRTYRASDVCGNSSTCTQIITVNDVTAPTITCPATLNVSCVSLVPVPSTSSVVSTDLCAGTVTVSYVSDVITNKTCTNRYTITRTYRATDVCGNSSTCTQTINVNDITAPVIIGVPANITINCNQPIPTPPLVTSTDNCGGLVATTYNQVSTQSPWTQLCEAYSYTVSRTWIATDLCGNTSSKVQVITVRDNTPPSWISTPPANITVQCNEDDVNNLDPIPSDACDPNPSLLFSFYYIPYLNGCVNSYTVVNTWTAGDRCGNTKQFVQHIYVVDTETPNIKCPADIIITSLVPIAVNWPLPTSDDYCDGALIPVQTGGPHIGSIFFPGTTTTITYTVTDGCGNTATCSFLVRIKSGQGKFGVDPNTPLYSSTEKAELFQNVPNPFETATKINFSLPQDQEVTIRIFDIDGKAVKVIKGDFNKGLNEITIQEGDLLSSGMYLYEMRSEGFIETKKMFYVK